MRQAEAYTLLIIGLFQTSCFPDTFLSRIDLLKFLFRCTTNIFTERSNTVRMMLQGQTAIGCTDFVISRCRFNFQHFVSLSQRISFQVQHGFHFLNGQTHGYCHFLQGIYFFHADISIALSYLNQEIQQLKPFFISQICSNLPATIMNGTTERLRIGLFHTLPLLKQIQQNLLSLFHCSISKIHTQETTYEFHFTVHDTPVRTNNVGSHHQHRKQETVSPSSIPGIFIIIHITSGCAFSALFHRTGSRIKKGTDGKTCQSSQRSLSHKPQDTSYPFSISHIFFLFKIPDIRDSTANLTISF